MTLTGLVFLLGFLLFLSSIQILVDRVKLGDARKTVEKYEKRNEWTLVVLTAYSKMVAELRKQGLTLTEGEDSLGPQCCLLRSKEIRPSGLDILVQASFNQVVNSEYFALYIGVSFPYRYDRQVTGISELRRQIADLTVRKFDLLMGTHNLHQISGLDFPDTARRIAEGVRFYEGALENVKQEILPLERRVKETEGMEKELAIKRSHTQKVIKDIVASLPAEQKLPAAS